jgi:hypothetical protein
VDFEQLAIRGSDCSMYLDLSNMMIINCVSDEPHCNHAQRRTR